MNKYAKQQKEVMRERLLHIAKEKTSGNGYMVLEPGLMEVPWSDARNLALVLLELGYDIHMCGTAASIKVHVPVWADTHWGTVARSSDGSSKDTADAYITDLPDRAGALSNTRRVFLLVD